MACGLTEVFGDVQLRPGPLIVSDDNVQIERGPATQPPVAEDTNEAPADVEQRYRHDQVLPDLVDVVNEH